MPVPIHPGIEAEKKTAEEAEKIRKETREYVERLERELQQTRNELSDLKAQQQRRQDAEAIQVILNRKQNRRDVLIGSAFSVGLTLLLEHLGDLIGIIKALLK
jgi:hypothetical protein